MGLGSLSKPKAHKVLGIDASTNSVAFCLMDNGTPAVSYTHLRAHET